MRAVKDVGSTSGCLVVIVGPKIGVQCNLGEKPVEIGRDPACEFPVDNDLVSRRHARVEWTGSGHRLVDLQSTNGTFVNDEKISSRELRDGDRIHIGKAILKFLGSNNIEAEYHQEIFHLMAHDGLTGIHNKRHFDEALASESTKPQGLQAPLSLIVFDIDHFKKINDTYGHAAGDAVLRRLASAVTACVPEGCLFARVGGEEFSVMCPGHDGAAVAALGETIRRTIEATHFEFERKVIPVTASVGAATRPPGVTQSGTDLYKAADQKLYEAKQSGRNRVMA